MSYPPPIRYAPLADPPPRPPRRYGLLLWGVLIGLVIGGGGVGLGWILAGQSLTGQPLSSATAEARAACQAISGAALPQKYQDLARPDTHRWSAAGELAAAAAENDVRYKPLSDALGKVEAGVQSADITSPKIKTAAQQALAFCEAN